MAKSTTPTLLQGTLDLLILHSLGRGRLHGYAIAQTIHLLSDEVLKVEEGSLYPALYRLELDGALSAAWGCRRTTVKRNTTSSRARPNAHRRTAGDLGPAFDGC